MIYINKNNIESNIAANKLHEWRRVHRTWSEKSFDESCKDKNHRTEDLWGWLDGGVEYNKEQLRADLFREQHGICCYCVCEVSLDKGKSVAEHFKDKGDIETRCATMYDYYNLLLSCPGNKQHIEPHLVKSNETIESIAEKKGCDLEEIKMLNKKTWNNLKPNMRLNLPKPPYHCDNAKGGFKTYNIEQDGSETYTIINPTKIDCWNMFSYDADGNIKGKIPLAAKTIKELNLLAQPLIEKRKKAWVRAREKFNDETEYDLSSVENIKKAFEDELKDTYHLCIVHRAYLLNEYPTVLKAYL